MNELEFCGINVRRRSVMDEFIFESYGRYVLRRVIVFDLGKCCVVM